jgi:hypothetical protein
VELKDMGVQYTCTTKKKKICKKKLISRHNTLVKSALGSEYR